MPRLFIAAVFLVNVGTASAISGAIDSPVRRFESALASGSKSRPETFRLQVAVRNQVGALVAMPQVVTELNTEAAGQAIGGNRVFALTASIEVPRNPALSYNPPSPCHIVNLRLSESGPAMDKPSSFHSMLKLCGEPIALPIAENRMITVSLAPEPGLLRTASLASGAR